MLCGFGRIGPYQPYMPIQPTSSMLSAAISIGLISLICHSANKQYAFGSHQHRPYQPYMSHSANKGNAIRNRLIIKASAKGHLS